LVGGKCQNPSADGSDEICGKALGAHPVAQVAPQPAAAITGSFGLTSFENLLRVRLPKFNPNIVARARRRFSAQINLAITENNVDSAFEVYEQTCRLPQTSTEMMLNFNGYLLNGPWNLGNDNFIICYKDTVPHILKALTPHEARRASSLSLVLSRQNNISPFLTSFELQYHEERCFMIMPSSLEKSSIADFEQRNSPFSPN